MVRRLLALGVVAGALLALGGCTSPLLTEVSCSDGLDNDGDGQTDAADADCADAVIVDSCNAFDATVASGCPLGMGCYLRADGRVECRRPGERTERQPCRTQGYEPSEPHDCARDYTCQNYDPSSGDQGFCARLCHSALQPACEASSFCNADPDVLGACYAICDPRNGIASGCPAGFRCLSGHQLGAFASAYDQGAAFVQCVNDTYGVRGEAGDGAECADPPNAGTPLFQVCASGFACVPGAVTGLATPTCRLICDATNNAGCPGGVLCNRLYPAGGGSPGYGGIEFGYCTP